MPHMLQNWIGPVMIQELTQVIDHFPTVSTRGRDVKMGRCLYHATGLAIHLRGGQPVQIINLHESQDNAYNITISDGTTYIRARVLGQSLTENDLGSIIGVEDYSLVYDGASKLGEQLFVEICDLVVMDSQGSADFGRPAAIWSQSEMKSLLDKLRELSYSRNTQMLSRSVTASLHEDKEFFGAVQNSSSAMEFNSQTIFATQMHNKKDKKHDVGNRSNDHETRTFNKGRILDALRKSKQNSTVWQDEPTADKVTERTSGMLATDSEHPRVLSQVSEEKLLRISSGIDTSVNVRRSQGSPPSPSSFHSSNPKALSPAADSPHQTTNRIITSDDGEKENSQESLRPGTITLPILRVDTVTPAVDSEQSKASKQPISQFPSDPLEGMKSVPRRYVKIRRDQQKLLADKDSWFQPVIDSRATYAIIPAKVQEDLATFITRVASKDSMQQTQDLDVSGDESEASNESDDKIHESSEDRHDTTNDQNYVSSGSQRGNDNVPPSPSRFPNIKSSLPSYSPSIPTFELEDNLSTPTKAEDNRTLGEQESRECSPWPSSPVTHRTHTLATLNRRPSPPSKSLKLSKDVEKCETAGLSTCISSRKDARCQLKRSPVTFPSSPAVEDELELDELHAIGDDFEYYDKDVLPTLEAVSEPPSTAMQGNVLVQVEQTPGTKNYSDSRCQPCSNSTVEVSRQRTRTSDALSSDPIIPATCNTARTQTPTSSPENTKAVGKPKFATQQLDTHSRDVSPENWCKSTDDQGDEYADNSATHIPTVLGSAPTQDSTASSAQSRTGIFPVNGGRPDISTSHNSKEQAPRQESIPQGSSTQDITTPPGFILAGKEGDASRNPHNISPLRSLKRGFDDFDEDAQRILMKRRRHTQAAAAIRLEESSERDTKAMARDGRHMFSDRLSAIELLRSWNSRPLDSEPSTKQPRPSTPLVQDASSSQVSGLLDDLLAPQSAKLQVQTLTGTVTQESHPATVAECTAGGNPSVSSIKEARPANPPAPSQSVLNLLRDADIYAKFTASYPDFVGSRRDFTWALVYVEWLRKAKQLLHRSLCDDFIRVISSDYVKYASNVRSTGGNAMTGWSFYDETVTCQKYSRGIITPTNLQDALSSLDQEEVERIREQFDQPRVMDLPQSREKEVPTSSSPSRQQVIGGKNIGKSIRRTIPWAKSTPRSTSNGESQGPTGRSTTLTPSPLFRHRSFGLPQSSKASIQNHSASRPQSPASGNRTEPPTSQASKRHLVESRISSSPGPTLFRAPSLSVLRDASASKAAQPSVIDGMSKVRGWLNDEAKAKAARPSFEAFIKSRKQRGSLSSNKSTPTTTPERRFCTKLKQATTEPREPETQAWEDLMPE